MKPLVVISIALVLCACLSAEEVQFNYKVTAAEMIGCSFDNFTWEDTGELAWRRGFGSSNWRVTQCAGRDPEPLRCHYYLPITTGRPILQCETENGELEDYRRLTGLI